MKLEKLTKLPKVKNNFTNDWYYANDYMAIQSFEPLEETYNEMTDYIKRQLKYLFDCTKYNKLLDLPDIKEIKASIKELCGRKRSLVGYEFGDILVNARYLIELMQTVDALEIWYDEPKKPLYIIGKKGTAILLPISFNKNMVREKGCKLL